MEDALKILQNADSIDELKEAVSGLESLFAQSQLVGSSSRRNPGVTPKNLGPAVAQLLKFCFGKLNNVSTSSQAETEKAPLYASAAILSIDGLSILQGLRPLEVEIQRYNLIRRLVSWQKYEAALLQGWILFASLRCQVAGLHAKSDEEKQGLLLKARAWHVNKVGLPSLRAASGRPGGESVESLIKMKVVELQSPGQGEATEMVTLVVGSILNLLICLPETLPMSMAALVELRPAIEMLGLWIR